MILWASYYFARVVPCLSISLKTASAANRKTFLGGSDARIIMGDDEGALVRLWQEKRGEVEPENLSGNLAVQLGLATENLNRRWYQAQTGKIVTDVQMWRRHPTLRWMAATLDGRVEDTCSRPSSCCRGSSRRRGRRKSMPRNCSTTCSWWRPATRSFR